MGKWYDIHGNYVNGKRHGYGVMTWPDGSSYRGEFYNDEITGKGKYIYADGKIYTGPMVKGKANGIGILEWPDGTRYEGEFVDNRMEGKGTLIYPDGRTLKGRFINGILVNE